MVTAFTTILNKCLFSARNEKNNRIQAALGVGESADLKELKTIYRNFMKDWHPTNSVYEEKPPLKKSEALLLRLIIFYKCSTRNTGAEA